MEKEIIKVTKNKFDDNNEFDFDRGDLLEEIDITSIPIEATMEMLNEQ